MEESKEAFIARRLDYHKAVLREKHGDIPDNALDFWAKDAAEKEFRTGRVYADPVQVEQATISVYDPREQFSSGNAQGLNLRFNPGGPMVSVMSLSYPEARELAITLIARLITRGEWRQEDEESLPVAPDA